MTEGFERVVAYHQSTKHHLGRFARGPTHLDWTTQPDPFRRYHGARVKPLEKIAPSAHPPYDAAFWVGHVQPEPLNSRSVSQLFFDSLALSAWKQAGSAIWSLRVNPSSGNLHPTEGYLICGPVDGLTEEPMVAHYAPREHVLEIRAEFPLAVWQALTAELPAGAILVGLSSIHWREAWKYGERAFRYCQHDVGHAIAAVSMAAAGLGWQATLLDDLGTVQLAQLLGISEPQRGEPEHPDCLLAVNPQGQICSTLALPERPPAAFATLPWQGRANAMSHGGANWSLIDDIAAATEKPATDNVFESVAPCGQPPEIEPSSLGLRQIIRQRRSAVAMDGQGRISSGAFYKILQKTATGKGQFPFNALPWHPLVHLVLFVHRIEGLAPGIYALVRNREQTEALQAAMKASFHWKKPPSCPTGLDLYGLMDADVRATARQLSCGQAIASDGCFSLGMIAVFEGTLQHFGPWFYRRLYWECGMIGQILYLEAEAAGVRGTGIGCFFDDAVHQLLGLGTLQYQSLYHFTVGHPVEDHRLTTLPAYPSS